MDIFVAGVIVLHAEVAVEARRDLAFCRSIWVGVGAAYLLLRVESVIDSCSWSGAEIRMEVDGIAAGLILDVAAIDCGETIVDRRKLGDDRTRHAQVGPLIVEIGELVGVVAEYPLYLADAGAALASLVVHREVDVDSGVVGSHHVVNIVFDVASGGGGIVRPEVQVAVGKDVVSNASPPSAGAGIIHVEALGLLIK